MIKDNIIRAAFLKTSLLAAVWSGVALAEGVPEPTGVPVAGGSDARQLVARYGTILASKPVGVGGLTAWTVKKGQGTVVLYTTADAQALFAGVVWDARTGRNLSDPLQAVVPNVQASQSVAGPVVEEKEMPVLRMAAAFDGEFRGELPESIKTVDSLAGVREGRGDVADTLYIIVDPRCPRSRQAFQATRPYVERGVTIKWIPTAALGDPSNGVPMAASILQADDEHILERMLGKNEKIKTPPTKETAEALQNNLSFLFAAFSHNSEQPAGVPVAFYIDRRINKPRMMTGVWSNVVLEELLGKI